MRETQQLPIHTAKTFTLKNIPPKKTIDIDIEGGTTEEMPFYQEKN
jgi:hypothetical protein